MNGSIAGKDGGRPLRYAILGGGMAGLLSGLKLRERGETDFTIYEKAPKVGGTWFHNRYPGLTCDFPSHNYSFSFAPNPDWSMVFSPGPEIQRYFEKIADDYGLREHLRLNCEVQACRFVDGAWEVTLADGTTDRVDVVIAATGVLHHPNIPALDGQEEFAGAIFHSARWNDAVELAGKRVGVVGSGSTGVQLVGALAGAALRLVHFNRTPQWVMPAQNGEFTDEQRAAFRSDPSAIEAVRNNPELLSFFDAVSSALVDASDPFLDVLQGMVEENLSTIADEGLREKLRPDHRVGCKRLVMSADYYPAVQRDDVAVERSPILRLEKDGVRLADGSFQPLDVLILATGFQVDRFVRPIEVVGAGGMSLDQIWQDRPRAYYAVTVPDFPNFFMINGPTGPVGNVSLIEIAEQQWSYIDKLIEPIREGACRHIQVTAQALENYDAARREAAKNTVWATGCQSWYLDESGVPNTWPWTFGRYREEMENPRFADYVRS